MVILRGAALDCKPFAGQLVEPLSVYVLSAEYMGGICSISPTNLREDFLNAPVLPRTGSAPGLTHRSGYIPGSRSHSQEQRTRYIFRCAIRR